MSTSAQLAQLSSASEILTDSATLAAYQVDESRPTAAALPKSPTEVAEIISLAAAQKLAVIPCAGRTKLPIGAPPVRYDVALDFSHMNRVLAYDPRDLTLGVEPGITFAELSKILAAENQFLPLAPPYSERATIGGIVAANVASPLRQFYGGPRDFVLGMEFVTGYGQQAKSGGRVVKNVTGYDLHKLLIGSLGTLAAITRINFKTFLLPPAQSTFVATFKNFAAAHEFCTAITRSPLEPFAVEIISPEASALLQQAQENAQPISIYPDRWSVLVASAGNEAVVARHVRDLQSLANTAHSADFVTLDAAAGKSAFSRIADFPPRCAKFNRSRNRPQNFRAANKNAGASRAAHGNRAARQIQSAIVVRPYGLIYFALVPNRVEVRTITQIASAADNAFRVCAENSARAFIELAPTEIKRRVNPWGPEREDLVLMRRVKHVFDPENVLSPGRFAGGI